MSAAGNAVPSSDTGANSILCERFDGPPLGFGVACVVLVNDHPYLPLSLKKHQSSNHYGETAVCRIALVNASEGRPLGDQYVRTRRSH